MSRYPLSGKYKQRLSRLAGRLLMEQLERRIMLFCDPNPVFGMPNQVVTVTCDATGLDRLTYRTVAGTAEENTDFVPTAGVISGRSFQVKTFGPSLEDEDAGFETFSVEIVVPGGSVLFAEEIVIMMPIGGIGVTEFSHVRGNVHRLKVVGVGIDQAEALYFYRDSTNFLTVPLNDEMIVNRSNDPNTSETTFTLDLNRGSGAALQEALLDPTNRVVSVNVFEVRESSFAGGVPFVGMFQADTTKDVVVRTDLSDSVRVIVGQDAVVANHKTLPDFGGAIAATSSVLVMTGDKDDVVEPDSTLTSPLRAYTYDGMDHLESGGGNDLLVGGQGEDSYQFGLHAGGSDAIRETGSDRDLVDFSFFSPATGEGVEFDLASSAHQPVSLELTIRLENPTLMEDVTGTELGDLILGNANSNTLIGRGGDDLIAGREGDDTLNGDAGFDSLIGDGFSQLVSFRPYWTALRDLALEIVPPSAELAGISPLLLTPEGSGNDTINTGAGLAVVVGGAGRDTINASVASKALIFADSVNSVPLPRSSLWSPASLPELLNWQESVGVYSDEKNTVVGAANGANIIFGGNGVDDLTGGAGNWDMIFGKDGADDIEAAEGKNIVLGGSNDAPETIRGGSDLDILIGDNVKLSTTTTFDFSGLSSASAISFVQLSLELDADGVGDDTIETGTGVNFAFGGYGADRILGGDGTLDVLFGNAGTDAIDGRNGTNLIVGGLNDEDETLVGGIGVDVIIGDDVEFDTQVTLDLDALTSGQLADAMTIASAIKIGGTGRDRINVGGGALNIALGGNDRDEIKGGDEGLDVLLGGDDRDLVYGGGGTDLIVGGAGDDQLFGATSLDDGAIDGVNAIFGDEVKVGVDFDFDFAKLSNFVVGIAVELSGNGADTIHGGNGDDFLVGGDGADTIFGHNGFNLAFGDDFTVGPLGNLFSLVADAVNPAKSASVEAAKAIASAFYAFFAGSEGDSLINGDEYYGGNGNDIVLGGDGNDVLYGRAGFDILIGGYGNDSVDAGEGGTTIAGEEFLLGLISLDNIAYGGNGDDDFLGGSGNDLLVSDLGNDTFRGGPGSDVLMGGEGADLFFGGDGHDIIYGGEGDDELVGENGNDELFGGDGDDALSGGEGDDLLDGGSGANVLDGGPGNNTIIDSQNQPPQLELGEGLVLFEGAVLQLRRAFVDLDSNHWIAVVTYGDGGGWEALTINTDRSIELLHTYLDNGQYAVTVKLTDEHGATAMDVLTVQVDNVAPVPALSGTAVAVPGQVVALSLAADDLSPVDRAAGFGFSVDWNDGTEPQNFVTLDDQPIAVSHLFKTTGIFQVAVVATDKDGAASTKTLMRIDIQAVLLIPNANDVNLSDLLVGGTMGADVIRFAAQQGGRRYSVQLNGRSVGTFSPTGNVVVFAQSGNDLIYGAEVAHSTVFYGGAGNDIIFGGRSHDVLLGGEGDDIIHGNDGRDVIIGGLGGDVLLGGDDDDILIGGYTSFDANLMALSRILAEWVSVRSYQQRRTNLLGSGSGSASNETIYLTSEGVGRTVYSDQSVNFLAGQSGRDWFFVRLVRSPRDQMLDQKSNEAYQATSN